MKTKMLRALVGYAGECAIAVLGLGCAQIFGFDKDYQVDGGAYGGGAGGGDGGSAAEGGGAITGSGAGGAATSSGSGGAATGGGAAGAGGGDPCKVFEAMPGEVLDLSLIDDMEDQDLSIPTGDGASPRAGLWFKDNDLSPEGIHEPENELDLMSTVDPPRGDSLVAVHTSANDGFRDWGAGVAFFLDNDDFYDASKYRGITFWARAGESSTKRMKVMFVDRQTRHTGGICDLEADGCYDHFHQYVVLADDWKRFKLPAACLKQAGFGDQFDAPAMDQLWGFYFFFDPGQAFDVWIDDVAFYR
ncbi:hypothetical protein BE04_00980 [Sorangium cellulosum]|uniref:CBM11 domain-containing protein n=1 Tax=Sorangium cellulosum TaxID=56 RepID=A0A150P3A3_SORCE|nr:hypothetical protein BE04_00980 [Sorangium cellulosum]